MDISYINKVREWVEIDNKILRSKDNIKEAVDKKKDLEEEILEYVEKNKLTELTLNISDGTIKFSKKVATQPLSIKTIKALMEKYKEEYNLDIDVNDICTFISSNLEKKTSHFMKRDVK